MNDKSFASWEEAVSWLKQQPDQQELVISSYYDDPLIKAAERYYQSEEWKGVLDFLKKPKSNIFIRRAIHF